MKANWIKMYDKHGCVLGVETVINDPYEFKVRRRGKKKGGRGNGRVPPAQGGGLALLNQKFAGRRRA